MAKVPRAPSLDKLRSINPAVQILPIGSRLWRLYFRGGQHPTQWSDFRHIGPLDTRFDHHLPKPNNDPIQQDRSVLYAAAHPLTCLSEVFQSKRTINRWYKDPWLVAFEITKPLALLDLTGAFATESGASMGLMSGPRSVARRWAQGYYEVYNNLHGLYYPSSMNANDPAMVLTDRTEALDMIPTHSSFHRALGDPAILTILRNAARTLGYRLA